MRGESFFGKQESVKLVHSNEDNFDGVTEDDLDCDETEDEDEEDTDEEEVGGDVDDEDEEERCMGAFDRARPFSFFLTLFMFTLDHDAQGTTNRFLNVRLVDVTFQELWDDAYRLGFTGGFHLLKFYCCSDKLSHVKVTIHDRNAVLLTEAY